MRKISALFTDEEKRHLSYLASMLRRERGKDREIQGNLDAMHSSERAQPIASKDVEREGKELEQKDAE